MQAQNLYLIASVWLASLHTKRASPYINLLLFLSVIKTTFTKDELLVESVAF